MFYSPMARTVLYLKLISPAVQLQEITWSFQIPELTVYSYWNYEYNNNMYYVCIWVPEKVKLATHFL